MRKKSILFTDDHKKDFRENTVYLYLLLFLCFPIGLYTLHKTKSKSRKFKTVYFTICAIFVALLAEQYDTMLSESGSNLSGGQRQLLSIARAVLANPKILILDEATSSVDTRTEMHIQQAMIALMKNRTSLIIAHRLSTIRDADKIIVIDDGRVVETGNHEQLLENKGCYYRLYKNQFAGKQT